MQLTTKMFGSYLLVRYWTLKTVKEVNKYSKFLNSIYNSYTVAHRQACVNGFDMFTPQ